MGAGAPTRKPSSGKRYSLDLERPPQPHVHLPSRASLCSLLPLHCNMSSFPPCRPFYAAAAFEPVDHGLILRPR